MVKQAIIATAKKSLPFLIGSIFPIGFLVILIILIAGCLLSIIQVAKEKATAMPTMDVNWIISADGKTMIPAQYLPIYQKLGKEYGVPWNLLAAIHNVETSFGRNLNTSSAGAVGHVQFMPCNWLGWDYYKDKCDRLGDFLPSVHIDLTNPKNFHNGQAVDYNKDGKMDPNNILDSVAAAAKRLANDKKRTGKDWFDRGGPVWKYNPSDKYVTKVEKYFTLFASQRQTASPLSGQYGGSITSSSFSMPAKGRYTGRFGENRGDHIHAGIDIAAPIGTPMYAVADGIVTRSKTNPGGFGYYVVINHGSIGGKSVETWYGHMYPNTVLVKLRMRVSRGQKIAEVGNNGRSSGPHLHFEVHVNGKAVEPLNWIPKR